MLQTPALPIALVWPSAGDVTDLQDIVWAQMRTVARQAILISAYQAILDSAQEIPPATATGTASGTPATTMTLTAVTGVILIGATVTGDGILLTPPTLVVQQTGGTVGGAGTYVISQPATSTAGALVFTPGGDSPPWPVSVDPDDLMLITQDQTALIRMQTALLSNYQTLLNDSAVPVPP